MNSTDITLAQAKARIVHLDAQITDLIGVENYAAYRQGVSKLIAADVLNMDASADELKKIKDKQDAENLALLGEHADKVIELFDERHHAAATQALVKMKRKGSPNRQRVLENLKDLQREPLILDDKLSLELFGSISKHYGHIERYKASDINKELFDKRVSCAQLPTNSLEVKGTAVFLEDNPICIIRRQSRGMEIFVLNSIRFTSMCAYVQSIHRPAYVQSQHKRLEDNDYVDLLGEGWIDQLTNLIKLPEADATEA